jgi:hypothetical protein
MPRQTRVLIDARTVVSNLKREELTAAADQDSAGSAKQRQLSNNPIFWGPELASPDLA